MDGSGGQDAGVGGLSADRWKRFIELTGGRPPWPRLVRAAELFDSPGEAVDVGAGAGRDTAYLLLRGWRVTAVDPSPHAAAVLRALPHQERLRVVVSEVEDFEPEPCDLLNAQFSLPFVPPPRFPATVARLRDAVRPGGVVAATFFGRRDQWNVPGGNLTFSAREDIEGAFAGWDVLELTELEEDGRLVDESDKHWHVFHLIARRRCR